MKVYLTEKQLKKLVINEETLGNIQKDYVSLNDIWYEASINSIMEIFRVVTMDNYTSFNKNYLRSFLNTQKK